MEKLWEEANLVASRRTSAGETPSQLESEKQHEEPAPPPPALRGRFGKLWERASSLGAGVVEKVSTTGPEKDRKNEEDARKLPSPPPEPEETPPKRFVPPLPSARTQAPAPPQLPPRDQSRVETTAPPVEEATPSQQDSILFEHDQHDNPQPVESSPVQSNPPIKPSELEKLESVVDMPKPPVLPPRASRHPPADIVRPGTPSAIPLPDSRPSTPTPTTTAERRRSIPSTPTKLDSGRSSSPMPGLAGAPPPIPRRAPARVRPVSVSIRPSTPLNQPPLNPPEEAKELGVNLPTTVDESAKPVEEAVPPAVAEVISGPDVIEPIFTKVEPRRSDAEVTRTAEASDPIALTEGSTTSPVDDVSHTYGDNSGLVNDQNLVGDKSWEDKTWREVVRLREEMFCARMGIVR